MVAQGFSQRPGLDYNETFSPVIKPATIRTILSITVTRKWDTRQVDINNAFLNGTIQEEVYMQQPEGFASANSHLVYKLKKSIYGLKQAPRAWFSKLASSLISFGFKPTRCDTSLFVHATPKFITYILVYVNDIIITGSSTSAVQYVISKLHSLYPLKDLDTLHFFLGIEAKYTTTGALLLSQSKYITDLLAKVNMHNAKPIKTPLAPGSKLHMDGTNAFSDPTLYRFVVGALQYATITRPDIAYAVNKLCQFMHNPLESYWKVTKRVLRYLNGTVDHGLAFYPSQHLFITGYSDSDWADSFDMRFTSGFCVYLGNNLVSWLAKKQQSVSRSSTEVEFRSLAALVAEIKWLQSLLTELHNVQTKPPLLWCDNQGAVMITANPVLHSKSKHFELDLWFVREKAANGEIIVKHIPSQFQVADLLTKAPSSNTFLSLRPKLNVHQLPTLSLRGM